MTDDGTNRKMGGKPDAETGRIVLVDPRSLLAHDFGPHHPFKIFRLGLTYELISAYGLADLPEVRVLAPREASEAEAICFHEEGYLEALRLCDSGMWTYEALRHGLGTGDNPTFPGIYDWAMSVAGASIDCAAEIADGRADRAFNMTGGLHHAMPDRASGFCHVNDAVLAIHRLLDAGKRVAYVDLDAHHGDGVERAFYGRDDVLTVSVHQSGFTIFPGSGFVEDVGTGAGAGFAVNVPLLPGAGDAAYAMAMDEVVLPAVEAFAPDVLATQLGSDAIEGDVVANLQLSLRRFEACVRQFDQLRLPWLAFGGGGYDVGNVVRAWTMAWAILVGRMLPDEIPSSWIPQAGAHGIAVPSLRGPDKPTPTTDHAMESLRASIEQLRSSIFPILEAEGERHR